MPKMPICSVCGQDIPRGSSYLVVLEREGKLQFRWGCEHNPIGDAAFIFGSKMCSDEWIKLYPLLQGPYALFMYFTLTQGVNCCED